MPNKTNHTIGDSLNIVWTIASKDIVDAIKNKVVVSMILTLSIVLLLPKMLPLIFENTPMLPIFDSGDSNLLVDLGTNPDISVQKVLSEQELHIVLCGSVYPQIGLQIPVDFNQITAASGRVDLQGYICWGKRHQVSELQTRLEGVLTQALKQPVTIHINGNIVYPPSEGILSLSMVTINSVLMILVMGVFLVPSLFFEEKETKTIQALLVSPASIGQVVLGKALAGGFYILVTSVIIFVISWQEVTHWSMALLFMAAGGLFSVAAGLVLGSFFEKQYDVLGWMMALLLILIGAVLAKMLGMELPTLVESILPWIPSIAMGEICRAAYLEVIPVTQVLNNVWVILTVSLPLYALVIWKVRRSDR